MLPELARVLCPQGVLQLMFKNGRGILTVFDQDHGMERNFQLHEENGILGILGQQKVTLIRRDSPDDLAGLLRLTDSKSLQYCLLFARKDGVAHQP